MGLINELGSSAAQSAGGAIMGLALGGYNDRRQLRQAEKLQGLQIKGQKELADYGQGLGKDMWDYTNLENQRKHAEAAGLSVGLLYGGQGAGGATVASPSAGQVSGGAGGAPQGGGEVGMGIGAMMTAAQLELMKAQTAKTLAEAENIAGVERENIATQTMDLTAGIENKAAQKQLIHAQTQYQTILSTTASGSQEEQIRSVGLANEKVEQEIRSLGAKGDIDEATVKEKIAQVRAESIGAILKNDLTKEQTREISVRLTQEWERLSGQVSQRDIERTRAKITWELGKMNLDQRKAEMIADGVTNLMRGGADSHHRSKDREFREREADRQQGNYERNQGY